MAHDPTLRAERRQLTDDFNKLLVDTETLLKALGGVTGEKATAMRASVEESLAAAKQRLRSLEGAARERAAATAEATDEYVHENPWTAIGVAAVVGLLVGLVITGRR
jgi:ElaB/YqjD/DUF883 family membrane-anchored ribosome-binding protein